MKKIWVDGATLRVCWVVEGEEPIIRSLPWKHTVNEAEYIAVLTALNCEGSRFDHIEILSDSQLVIYQLTGKYKVREPRLKSLFIELKKLITWKGLDVAFKWIPREENLAGQVLG